MEPPEFHCLVEYEECRVIIDRSMCLDDEEDEKAGFECRKLITEVSDTGMLKFCRNLLDDIRKNRAAWDSKDEEYFRYDTRRFDEKFKKLEALIELREIDADDDMPPLGFHSEEAYKAIEDWKNRYQNLGLRPRI